jgi:WD40 repeat protein
MTELGLMRKFKRRGWYFFPGEITTIAFSPDGVQALSGSKADQGSDQNVRLWEVRTGKEICSLKSHRGGVRSVAFSPDGLSAVSAGGSIVKMSGRIYDAAVRLWDLRSQKEVARFGEDMFLTQAVAYTPDGRYVITGSQDKDKSACLRVWDIRTQKEVKRIGEHPAGVHSLCISPSGSHLLTGSFGDFAWPDQTIKMFDIEKGTEIPFINYRGRVNRIAYTPDGSFAIAGGSPTILLDLQTGREVRRYKSPHPYAYPYVHDIAISPDGRRLLTANGGKEEPGAPWEDCTVRLFEIHSGDEICAFSGHKGAVKSVAFSPDGRNALSGDEFGDILFWQMPE